MSALSLWLDVDAARDTVYEKATSGRSGAALATAKPYYMTAKHYVLLEPIADRVDPYLPPAKLAYAWSVAGALVAMYLTFMYVAGDTGAHEANPVTAVLIPTVGWAGLFAIKLGVIVLDGAIIFPRAVANGADHWDGCSPAAARLWLWLGAWINGADAVWDLFLTSFLPSPNLSVPPTGLVAVTLVGLVVAMAVVPGDWDALAGTARSPNAAVAEDA